jgi:hypothetical protein
LSKQITVKYEEKARQAIKSRWASTIEVQPNEEADREADLPAVPDPVGEGQ